MSGAMIFKQIHKFVTCFNKYIFLTYIDVYQEFTARAAPTGLNMASVVPRQRLSMTLLSAPTSFNVFI